MFRLECVKIVYSGLMIAGITLATTATTTDSQLHEILEHLDFHIEDKNHDLQKDLHQTYLDNLKTLGSGALLLVHDIHGNLHESTYHYLGLKIHEMYEIITTFLAVSRT